MKSITLAMMLALAPAVTAAQAQSSNAGTNAKQQEVTLEGCVVPGVDKNTAALKTVTEIAEPGHSVMPAEAHGRRVVFWLTPDDQIVQHVGQMVQVRGVTSKIEKSEIELKPGHQASGGTVVEFEGPGKDVKVSNDAIGDAIGTSGKKAGDKDVPTFLIRVNVNDVKQLEATCR
jgi:hypothetical protein